MTVWLNNPFDPLPGEGGRPLRYWLLARALVAAGHRVVWWSSDFHHLRKLRRRGERVCQAEGFEVRLVQTPAYASNIGWRRWRSHARYAAAWERLARQAVADGALETPAVIVVSLPPLGVFDAAARLREAWGCRIVVDVQDVWPETFYQLLPPFLRERGPSMFARFHRMAARAYGGADRVSAVCQRYAALAREKGGRTDAPAVFRLGAPLPEPVLREPQGAARALRLCYLGNLGRSYDIRTMVRGVCALAAEGLPVTLDVAGDGAHWGWVAGVAAGRRNSPVRFHGYLDEVGVRACLQAADIGVVPMRDASGVAVPNKVVDYAASGLAMVCGLSGEALELLTAYGAGVGYEPGNVGSFMHAVRRYAGDAALLERHRAGARRLAEEVFDERDIYPRMAVFATTFCDHEVAANGRVKGG